VNDRGWERLLWLRDDLAQLAGPSIYRARKQWPVNRAGRAAARGRRKHWRNARWLLPWRYLRRSPDAPSVTIRDVVKRPDTRRKTQRRRLTGVLTGPSRKPEGRYGGHRSGVQRMGKDDLFTPRRYPTSQARIPTPVTRIAAEGVVGGEDSLRWRSDPQQSLYHRELPSVRLTVNVWAQFSLNFPWQPIRGSAANL
jgi:hypothetical protein